MIYHTYLKQIGLAAGFALSAAGAFAGPVNITIYDQKGPEGVVDTHKEDNEAEPGMVQSQQWDLERIVYHNGVGGASAGLTGGQMAIIGGYDFSNGFEGYHSGDIWIDINPGLEPLPAAGLEGYELKTGTNADGYDFVLHFDNRANIPAGSPAPFASNPDAFKLNGLTYQVIDLRGASVDYWDVNFGANGSSNPFVWVSGGQQIGSGSAIQNTIGSTGATNAFYGPSTAGWQALTEWSGTDIHYSLTVSLIDIVLQGVDLDEAKFTMGCGNDMIRGDFSLGNQLVPDGGASLILVGLGFAALGAFARRRKA